MKETLIKLVKGKDIDHMVLYNLEEQKSLVCDAIEIELASGQVIFLDPSYYFGINIGGKEQKQMWEINLKDTEKIRETIIKISDSR